MGKIHLLMKKEEIDQVKMQEDKVAVVFDVLLATSTITAALHYGATEVIPVLNQHEAEEEAKQHAEDSYVLVGEYMGKTLNGFLSPNPYELKDKVKGKTVILSTTNGTVAIKKSADANKVYVASLLNGEAISDQINIRHKDKTIIIVCSGSSGEFNIEDFYGAGYLIECLQNSHSDWELTDAALAAFHFYNGVKQKPEEILRSSRVGSKLAGYGYDREIEFVAQHNKYDIVPYLIEKKRIVSNHSIERKKVIPN